MQRWDYFIQCPADSYTVVVIRVVPKRMADDRLVCMKWVDERKTTSDKGVNMLWWHHWGWNHLLSI